MSETFEQAAATEQRGFREFMKSAVRKLLHRDKEYRAPRPKGYTPIPNFRNGYYSSVLEPLEITEADWHQPLTQSEIEDREAVDAAMLARDNSSDKGDVLELPRSLFSRDFY